MEKLVVLNGKPDDLNHLMTDLQDEPLHITKRTDDYFLESLEFNKMSNKEAFDCGKLWVKKINSLMNLIYGYNPMIDTNCVQETDVDGTVHKHGFISVEFTTGKIMLHVVQTDKKSRLPNLLKIRDTEIDKAIELFNAPNWVNLYKVYEIIQDDPNGVNLLKTFKTEVESFAHTANCRNAIGDNARHATLKYKSPKKPVSYDDAKKIIRNILIQWIEIKSNND